MVAPADNSNLSKAPEKPLITRGRAIALIALLMLTFVASAWFTGLIAPDPRLAEIRDLQEKLGDQLLSDKDHRATFDELGKKLVELPDSLRQKFLLEQERMNSRGQGGGGQGGVSPGQLLAMPEDQRNAEIDKILDRTVDFQKRQEQVAKNRQGGSGGSGGQPDQERNLKLSSMPVERRAIENVVAQLVQARAEQRGIRLRAISTR
jgi:hypothetical protein